MKPMLSDTMLRDAVMKELNDDPEVSAEHISVTAIDGAITLRGHVMTYHERHEAVRAAERVSAVKAVADDLEVRSPDGHERTDDEIAEAIAQIRNRIATGDDNVAVQVRDGRVILHGEVESAAQRDHVESVARQLAGVRAVSNLLEVKALSQAVAESE